MTLAEARSFVRQARAEGKKVVFTNGVFDVLHVGHVRYLEAARQLGDLLVVGLNSDRSASLLKGPSRPLVPQQEREELLLGLRSVDAVVIFDEQTAEHCLEVLRPDVYAKGGDYTVDQLPEAKIVQAYGGEVRVLLHVEGHSTTNLIDLIHDRFCPDAADASRGVV